MYEKTFAMIILNEMSKLLFYLLLTTLATD